MKDRLKEQLRVAALGGLATDVLDAVYLAKISAHNKRKHALAPENKVVYVRQVPYEGLGATTDAVEGPTR